VDCRALPCPTLATTAVAARTPLVPAPAAAANVDLSAAEQQRDGPHATCTGAAAAAAAEHGAAQRTRAPPSVWVPKQQPQTLGGVVHTGVAAKPAWCMQAAAPAATPPAPPAPALPSEVKDGRGWSDPLVAAVWAHSQSHSATHQQASTGTPLQQLRVRSVTAPMEVHAPPPSPPPSPRVAAAAAAEVRASVALSDCGAEVGAETMVHTPPQLHPQQVQSP